MEISTVLDPANLRITEENDTLSLAHQGGQVSDLSVVQCFPESDPGLWISLRNTGARKLG